MVVIPLLNYAYYAPTPLLNYRYYSQARSQNFAMGMVCYKGMGAEPPALETFVLFFAKVI